VAGTSRWAIVDPTANGYYCVVLTIAIRLLSSAERTAPNNEENDVKKFMILHFGFEKPTPEIMEEWKKWFASIADVQVDQGGFAGGKEISSDGTAELSWGPDCITGYNIINAESLDDAAKLCESNPFIKSIRVYEIRAH
jgi:hypothetical protein